MKNYTYILLIGMLGFLASCEDKIDLDLGTSNNLIVIDAFLNNNEAAQEVIITTTHDYLDNTVPPKIDNAEVRVNSSNGNEYTFNFVGEGKYMWFPNDGETLGSIGDSFTLSVIHEGTEYSATTILNRTPVIDSIMQEERSNAFEDGIYCQFFARDFIGLGDVYWVKSFKNGVYLNKPQELNIAYDASFDRGGEVDGLIFIPPIRDLVNPFLDDFSESPWAVGDEIRVEIHSISEDIFAFLELGRDQIINGDNSIFAEPLANTIGNIENTSGGTKPLGAFNVAAVSSLSQTIQ